MRRPEPVPIRPPDQLHLATEAVEQYVFAQLKPVEKELLEEHLLSCDYCRRKLDFVENEIRLLREALGRERF
jgi:predicted anti-sigma-YlaC factor YlaD